MVARTARRPAANRTTTESHAASGGGDTVHNVQYVGIPDEDSADMIRRMMESQAADSDDSDGGVATFGQQSPTTRRVNV